MPDGAELFTRALTAALTVSPSPADTPPPFAVGGEVNVWSIILTAVVGFLAATLGSFVGIRFERRKAMNEALITKRIEVYDVVIPRANSILCFFICVGDWRSSSPPQVIGHKRAIDQAMAVNGLLFSDEVRDAHTRFVKAYFRERSGVGAPAKLRADRDFLERQWGRAWRTKWSGYIEPPPPGITPDERRLARAELRQAYDELVDAFAADIGVPRSARGVQRPATTAPSSGTA